MSSDLSSLVDPGNIDAALLASRGLDPERIRESLFRGDGFMTDSADWFARAYLTELADVPHAEQIGAKIATESKKLVIEYLAESIGGKDLEDWATSQERPLSQDQRNAWREAAQQLREISVP